MIGAYRRSWYVAATAGGVVCGLATGGAFAGNEPDYAPIPSREVEVSVDSGRVSNHGADPQVIWSAIVEAPGAPWIRLQFDQADLAIDRSTGWMSTLRIMSLADGATQSLDAMSMREWGATSAYFNGDAVSVEMIGAPGGLANRIAIDRVTAGEIPGEPDSICGNTDDRELSEDVRIARALPAGCTAWLIDGGAHCFLTAGHCIVLSSVTVVEFNVPLSDPNGAIQHPPPEDQYPVDPASMQGEYVTIGDDWAFFGTFPNSETGLPAWIAQGDWLETATPPNPDNNDEIRITGYGVVDFPVPREWNQVQKTHVGPYADRSGTWLQYRTDTTGGNSGSPVIFEPTGEAIGIHTHGGCSSQGGANSGTGFDNRDLQAALAAPRGVCEGMFITADPFVGGEPARITAINCTVGETVYFIYSLVGEGNYYVPALDVTLGLASPQLAGSVVAGNDGLAEFISDPLPQVPRPRLVWLQAAEAGRVSNVEVSQIN